MAGITFCFSLRGGLASIPSEALSKNIKILGPISSQGRAFQLTNNNEQLNKQGFRSWTEVAVHTGSIWNRLSNDMKTEMCREGISQIRVSFCLTSNWIWHKRREQSASG